MSRTKDNKRVMEVETLEERCTPAVLDLRTAGALGQVNGAIFEQVAAQPTGTEQGMYTDKFGHYEFDNLAVGLGGLSTYAVQEVVPDGYFAQDANSAYVTLTLSSPTQVVNFHNLTFVTSETPPSAPNS